MLTLHFDVKGALREAARECEAEIFLRWFGNTREELALEYDPYDQDSVFMVVADSGGGVIGVCRLILPGPAGLKTIRDVTSGPWHVDGDRAARAAGVRPEAAWDIATLGVRDATRGRSMLAAAALYHGLVVSSRVNEVPSVVSIVDEQVRALTDAIGMILPALPGTGPAPYLGSPASTPVYGHCQVMVDTQRRLNPDAHRLICLGVGLDGISVPGPDAFRLRRREAPIHVRHHGMRRAGATVG